MKNQGFQLFRSVAFLTFFASAVGLSFAEEEVSEKHQYAFENIKVVPASADEPLLEHFSAKKADEYLEAGATAWTKGKNCISCHTNGSYLLLRPALTKSLGKPSEEIRDFYVSVLEKREAEDPEKLKNHGVTPSELALLAAGLAEWDAHVTHQLSDETRRNDQCARRVRRSRGSPAGPLPRRSSRRGRRERADARLSKRARPLRGLPQQPRRLRSERPRPAPRRHRRDPARSRDRRSPTPRARARRARGGWG